MPHERHAKAPIEIYIYICILVMLALQHRQYYNIVSSWRLPCQSKRTRVEKSCVRSFHLQVYCSSGNNRTRQGLLKLEVGGVGNYKYEVGPYTIATPFELLLCSSMDIKGPIVVAGGSYISSKNRFPGAGVNHFQSHETSVSLHCFMCRSRLVPVFNRTAIMRTPKRQTHQPPVVRDVTK